MGALVVLTTLANANAADRLARRTVREKKAACVSVMPAVTSHYRWKGKIRKTREALLFIKTTSGSWPKLLKFLEKNHPYDVPEILALRVSHGSKAYLSWLRNAGLMLCLVLAGTLFSAHPLWAESTFVKYSDVQKEVFPEPRDLESVTPEELRKIQEDEPSVKIFDARSKTEFNKQHIAGATLPMPPEHYRQEALFQQKIVSAPPDEAADLNESMASLARTTPIITYCSRNCGLSKGLMIRLKALGFTNVRYLAGGIDSWREKKYPIEVVSQD